MPDEPDGDLLRRFVHGDADALEALYRQFGPDVHRWILRILRDVSAADDALVEVFWRAHRGRARFDPSRSFGAWMRRIATNVAQDHLRKARRTRRMRPADERIPAPPGSDPGVTELVTNAFAALPPKLRVVAALALIDERPYAEIAEALNVPIGTREVARVPRDSDPAGETDPHRPSIMMDDDELKAMMRSALPSPSESPSSRDLWPRVVDRLQSRPESDWIDIALAALVVTLLAIFPEWLFVLAYHL